MEKRIDFTRKDLPSVAEIGGILEEKGLVTFGKSAYNQTGDNCFEIASEVAETFGYLPLKSRRELVELMDNFYASKRGWEIKDQRLSGRSPACLNIRRSDDPSDVHVAFEVYGREYNYGSGVGDGFEVQIKIPLERAAA